MIADVTIDNRPYRIDLSNPIDISMPLRAGKENVQAFFIPDVKIEPFRAGSFVGSVSQGGSCNVNNIFFNPHGNGTHTECIGHISKEFISLNQCLKKFFYPALLITVQPEKTGGDEVIGLKQFSTIRIPEHCKALVIRTLPNGTEKLTKNYSGTNPAYIEHEAMAWIRDQGIEHLLIDLPSVDREDDGGKLLAHHAFWKYPGDTRLNSTITEFIYVPDVVKDGMYLINIMIASFENDASPSKPVLYALI